MLIRFSPPSPPTASIFAALLILAPFAPAQSSRDAPTDVRPDTTLLSRPDAAASRETAPSKLEVASADAVDPNLRKLAGQTVQGVNGEKLGTTKDFVIDRKSGEVVYAIVSAGARIGTGNTLRLVPIHALQPAPAGGDGYIIKVGRTMWDRSPALINEAFAAGVIQIRPPGGGREAILTSPRDENLAPTGRPTVAATSPASPNLVSALRAARQALDQHEELARADITLIAEPGVVRMSGKVASERHKKLATQLAEQAASGVRIDNQLVVETTR